MSTDLLGKRSDPVCTDFISFGTKKQAAETPQDSQSAREWLSLWQRCDTADLRAGPSC